MPYTILYFTAGRGSSACLKVFMIHRVDEKKWSVDSKLGWRVRGAHFLTDKHQYYDSVLGTYAIGSTPPMTR